MAKLAHKYLQAGDGAISPSCRSGEVPPTQSESNRSRTFTDPMIHAVSGGRRRGLAHADAAEHQRPAVRIAARCRTDQRHRDWSTRSRCDYSRAGTFIAITGTMLVLDHRHRCLDSHGECPSIPSCQDLSDRLASPCKPFQRLAFTCRPRSMRTRVLRQLSDRWPIGISRRQSAVHWQDWARGRCCGSSDQRDTCCPGSTRPPRRCRSSVSVRYARLQALPSMRPPVGHRRNRASVRRVRPENLTQHPAECRPRGAIETPDGEAPVAPAESVSIDATVGRPQRQ